MAFQPGVTYTISGHVNGQREFNYNDIISGADALYSVAVQQTVNMLKPPLLGSCTVNPPQGHSIETLFNIECGNWTAESEDFPLRYVYGYTTDSSTASIVPYVPLTDALDTTEQQVLLPFTGVRN
jgi:hypothetical protein